MTYLMSIEEAAKVIDARHKRIHKLIARAEARPRLGFKATIQLNRRRRESQAYQVLMAYVSADLSDRRRAS